jgi:L,D-transpeptidase ErfK/SrfK
MRTVTMALTVVLLAASGIRAQEATGAILVGGPSTYVVRAGDTLSAIAGRFGMSTAAVVALNHLPRPDAIAPGQRIAVDTSHLAAVDTSRTITINVAQRMLFVAVGEHVTGYAVTVGTRGWPTPLGPFTIVDKERNPVWDVPVSIQAEMKAQGKPVLTTVPPSPQNPLGAHWLRLSIPGLGIHGTNAPSSIYRYASHGCIRMHPDDIAAVFDRVAVGTTGILVYQPILIGVIDGRVILEASPDPYNRLPDAVEYAIVESERLAIGHRIDWSKANQALRERAGRPQDVTRGGSTQ